MHEPSDVFREDVVCLNIFVESMDDERWQGAAGVGKQNDQFSETIVGADGDYHILYEVVAVVKTLVPQHFAPRTHQLDRVAMVGPDQFLDLSLELHLLLLLLLNQ